MERNKSRINSQTLIEINKRLNELGGDRQTNFSRQKIKAIVTDMKSQTDPVKQGAVLYYRTVSDHPFRGANRRTAILATHMLLHENGRELKLPPITETKAMNQRIRDKRLSKEDFERMFGNMVK